MIIANRLNDGLVVFYTPAGGWSTDIAEGVIFDAEADEDRLVRAAKADEEGCVVIDPYAIDVADAEGARRPTSIREAIRAFGPTV